MFGGLCFLLDGKMICGVLKDDLIAKIGREDHEGLPRRNMCVPSILPANQ